MAHSLTGPAPRPLTYGYTLRWPYPSQAQSVLLAIHQLLFKTGNREELGKILTFYQQAACSFSLRVTFQKCTKTIFIQIKKLQAAKLPSHFSDSPNLVSSALPFSLLGAETARWFKYSDHDAINLSLRDYNQEITSIG